MQGFLVALLLLCSLAVTLRAQDASRPYAFTGVTLVDVRTGELQPGTTVLVEDKHIRAIGPTGRVPLPKDARVIDAQGKYLIPGLIDTHVHLFQPWHRNFPDTVAQFGWIMAGGVTTVRDAAATGLEDNYIALRAARDSGRILAPRIRISGFVPGVSSRTGAATVTEAVSHFPSLGWDAIKLRGSQRDQALDIIRAAREAGIPVYGHTRVELTDSTSESYTLAAVRAGISGLSHFTLRFQEDAVRTNSGPRITYQSSLAERAHADLHALSGWLSIDPAWRRMLIDSMVAYGTWLEPTLVVSYHDHEALYGRCTDPYDADAIRRYYTFHQDPTEATLTHAQADSVRGICAAMKSFVRDFYQAGGTIITGADYPPFPPLGVTEEMRLLVEAGLPPLAALQAATINAARALQMEEEIGTIEVGKFADLVLLDANPLEDIQNVRKISAVVADGEILDRGALLARAGTNPPMVAYDDLLEKMDDRLRKIAFEHPDSIIDVIIYTNDLARPEDLRRLGNPRGFTIVLVEGGVVHARGPAFAARIVSRIRFVERIELAT